MKKFFLLMASHWFGLLCTTLLSLSFLFFILVILSPREDLQKRGFIPCTESMVLGMKTCPTTDKYGCMFGKIIENSWCDITIIGQGFKLWVSGEQNAPWSNYLFTPDLTPAAAANDEALQEFYKENPNIKDDLAKLEKLNEDLENGKK